jgi:hypothetical protein
VPAQEGGRGDQRCVPGASGQGLASRRQHETIAPPESLAGGLPRRGLELVGQDEDLEVLRAVACLRADRPMHQPAHGEVEQRECHRRMPPWSAREICTKHLIGAAVQSCCTLHARYRAVACHQNGA